MTLEPVTGADLHDHDTFLDASGVAHTVDHFDAYPGRTVGDTMRRACCTDGTCWTIADHHHYNRLAA